MQMRRMDDRRTDKLTAERIDLAVLTARAFDLRAAQTYLTLSGIGAALVVRFVSHYPDRLRATTGTEYPERRRRRG
jgi:hypothetical protein